MIIPLITAILLMFFIRFKVFTLILNLLGSLALFTASVIIFQNVDIEGIQTLSVGGWKSPFGITFVADTFTAIMILIAGIISVSASIYFFSMVDEERRKYGFYIFFQTMMMGVCGSFVTGDIFNLYVWFEVMLISSFVLLVIGSEKQQVEGAVKYVAVNLISSVIFLSAAGLLYGLTGTLNMADLSQKVSSSENTALITTVSMMFLVSFGIKSAIFPLFFWLPASYHTPPIAVTAIFSALLTKTGVYSMIRMFTLVFRQDIEFTNTVILFIAGFSMITGVLGALVQKDIRRILIFQIISKIGYLLMGLGIFTALSLTGSVFFMMHIIITKTILFYLSGIIYIAYKSYELSKSGSIYKWFPFISLLFLISAGSLSGIPPFSGFWAKFLLIKAGFIAEYFFISAIALLVSILTLITMLKIWNESFWKDSVCDFNSIKNNLKQKSAGFKISLYLPVILLVILMLAMSFYPEPFYYYAEKAGNELMNPEYYINAVLTK